jgi:hypothetical protein
MEHLKVGFQGCLISSRFSVLASGNPKVYSCPFSKKVLYVGSIRCKTKIYFRIFPLIQSLVFRSNVELEGTIFSDYSYSAKKCLNWFDHYNTCFIAKSSYVMLLNVA